MNINTGSLIVAVLGVIGFFLALFIHHKKSRNQKMVCMIGEDCDKVVKSEYSKFLGIPVEILGMVYYALVALTYGFSAFFPGVIGTQLTFWIISVAIGAFLFSGYLVFIQGFVLKEWCEWCLSSAFICLLIFIAVFLTVPEGLLSFLYGVSPSISIILGLALSVGVGSATVSGVLFLRFLKDSRVSDFESQVLRVVSQVTIVSVGIFIVASLGLFLPDIDVWREQPVWLISSIVTAVILISEVLLYLRIAPHLINISFGEEHEHVPGELKTSRRLAFVLSAVCVVSWYFLYVISSTPVAKMSLSTLSLIYAVLLVLSVIVARTIEYSFSRKIL